MQSETRANLIFLVIFVLLALPGGVILFLKKLDPAEPPMYLPHPVRHELASVDPKQGGSELGRVTGPRLRAFREQIDASPMRGTDATDRLPPSAFDPIQSASRQLELRRIDRNSGQLTGRLLVWDRRAAACPTGELVLLPQPRTDEAVGAAVEGRAMVELPAELRAELQAQGYVDPPRRALVMDFTIAPANSTAFTGILVTCRDPAVEYEDEIRWPAGKL
jgi:hypothetical protein